MTEKYRVSVDYFDGTSNIVWNGVCSKGKVEKVFHSAIIEQKAKYETDKKSCFVRVYDKDDNVIRQETFH